MPERNEDEAEIDAIKKQGDGGRLVASGIRRGLYYGIPNHDIELRGTSHGIRLKQWRAVAHPFNIFAIKSLVDEMAKKQGHPLGYVLHVLFLITALYSCFLAHSHQIFTPLSYVNDSGLKFPFF